MKDKILMVICCSAFLLFSSSNVKAFQITDNQIVDTNKIWTVNFTGEVGFDDLTKNVIVVTDSKGNKVNTSLELGSDNKTVIVKSPQNGYAEGENYTLTIGKNAHNKNNRQMKQDRAIHFSIKKSTNTDLQVINSPIPLPQNPNDEDNYIVIGKRKFEVGQFKQLMIGYEGKINDVINSIDNCQISTGGCSNGRDMTTDSSFGIMAYLHPSNDETGGDTYIDCNFNGDGTKTLSIANIPMDTNVMKAIFDYFPKEYTKSIGEDFNAMQNTVSREMDNNMDDIQNLLHNKGSKIIYEQKFTDNKGVVCHLEIVILEGKFQEIMSFTFK